MVRAGVNRAVWWTGLGVGRAGIRAQPFCRKKSKEKQPHKSETFTWTPSQVKSLLGYKIDKAI